MSTELVRVDYHNSAQASDLIRLLNDYACDPMGGAEDLSAHSQNHLVDALRDFPGAFSILCYVDGVAAGLTNCFTGFSTFKCKPLVNVHDMTVGSAFRGLGLSQLLLAEVEAIARERGCCKVTLEVLSGNQVAKNAYLKFGYEGYALDPSIGHAEFWQKTL